MVENMLSQSVQNGKYDQKVNVHHSFALRSTLTFDSGTFYCLTSVCRQSLVQEEEIHQCPVKVHLFSAVLWL